MSQILNIIFDINDKRKISLAPMAYNKLLIHPNLLKNLNQLSL